MATVVISDTLISTVCTKVESLFAARLNEANIVPPHWYNMVMQGLIPAEHRELISKLPKCYFVNIAHISVTFNHPDYSRVFTIRGAITLLPHVLDPAISGAKNRYGQGSYELDYKDPRWAQLFAEYKTWSDTLNNIVTERAAAAKNASTLLRQYRTLAPALKAWPALWDLLPPHVQDRHKQITEKKPREKVEREAVDLSGVTSQIVANKLQGKLL